MILKVHPPVNIGPPLFSPSLQDEPFRIKLGENGIFWLPQIIDPDLEDTNPTLHFENSNSLLSFLRYDAD